MRILQLHCDYFGDIIDKSVTTHNYLCLTLCLLGNFAFFLLSADLFFKIICFKNSFGNTMGVPNSLDPYQAQAQKSVRPDLGLNCLQNLSADDTCRNDSDSVWKFLTFKNIRGTARDSVVPLEIKTIIFSVSPQLMIVFTLCSSAMPGQAEKLVERMKKESNIDFENDWKVITIFVGGNDLCDFCDNKVGPKNILVLRVTRPYINLLAKSSFFQVSGKKYFMHFDKICVLPYLKFSDPLLETYYFFYLAYLNIL